MNPHKLEDWRISVSKLNEEAGKIIHDRDELYKFIADDIKKVFARMNLYPENVNVNSTGKLIEVEFKSLDDIILDPVQLMELHMKFRLSHGIDNRGNWRYVLKFYPFEED